MEKTVTLTKSVSYNFHKGEITIVIGPTLGEIKKGQAFLDNWAVEEIERLKKYPVGPSRGAHVTNNVNKQENSNKFTITNKQKKWLNDMGYTGDFSEITSRPLFDDLISHWKGASTQDIKNDSIAKSSDSDTAF